MLPYITKEINNYKEEYYKNYDEIFITDMPENTPTKFKILKCNQHMVDSSDFLLCYITHDWGGATKTIE